jgi:minor extracellular serine protease Vpr
MSFRAHFLTSVLFLTLTVSLSAASYNHYAVILQDEPVRTRSGAVPSPEVATRRQSVIDAQASLRTQLELNHVQVTGSAQSLLNALFVVASPDQVDALRALPGVKAVVKLGVRHLHLDKAAQLINAPAAWTAAGGIPNAGLGMKIGIIDTGIDQNHPGFNDPSLPPVPHICSGSDCDFTNNKVIVARSYVRMEAAGTQPNPAADSAPDDYSPRDHVGHGTAVAMVAGGNTNTGPSGETITGIAPKAYLGNYKVYGSGGVNPGATDDVLIQAIEDAFNDGMNIVNLSTGQPAISATADTGAACDNPSGVPCDLVAQTYENAVQQGLVVVASAGNSGFNSVGNSILGGLGSPATAADVIAVAASTNSHTFINGIHVNAAGTPAGLQNVAAEFGDGPLPSSPLTAPAKDIAAVGDALGCTAPPAGSLTGYIAIVLRGNCTFVAKVQNAQTAGAVGVIFTLANATDLLLSVSPAGLSATTIPSVLISQPDGQTLRSFISSNTTATVTIDPNLLVAEAAQADTIADFSSRGPALQSGPVKPDITAVGTDVYMAAQHTDPDGELYSPTGYIVEAGTSFSSPMTAGAAALVKQKNPNFTPAQVRSALVNSANATTLTEDNGSAATLTDSGAGKLDVAAALNASVTVSPSSVFFGVLNAGATVAAVPLQITNSGTAALTLTFAGGSRISVSPSSLSVAAGQTGTVNVALPGAAPTAGSYQGQIAVTGAPAPLHIPFSYVVGSGTAAYISDLLTDGQLGAVGQPLPSGLAIQILDQFGAPVANAPVRFAASPGAAITQADSATNQYGIAYAGATLGATQANYAFTASAGGLTYRFQATARLVPAIADAGVVNSASQLGGAGVTPGSYITVYGSALADGTFVNTATSLQPGLQGVSVSFDVPSANLSVPGYINFVSPGQVNVQVPWELAGQSSVQMKVTADGVFGNVITVPVANYAPAIFTYGQSLAAALDQNYQLIGASNAARRGQTISIYASGLGPVNNQPASGDPAPSLPLASTQSAPVVTIGGVAAAVQFSGLAPQFTGLYQLNVTVPSNAPVGAQTVTVSAGGVTSPAATLNIQ